MAKMTKYLYMLGSIADRVGQRGVNSSRSPPSPSCSLILVISSSYTIATALRGSASMFSFTLVLNSSTNLSPTWIGCPAPSGSTYANIHRFLIDKTLKLSMRPKTVHIIQNNTKLHKYKIQIQNYTNTALVKVADRHDMCYIFEKVIVWGQSSYLSQISQIYLWRKNLSCGEISDFYKEFEQFMEFLSKFMPFFCSNLCGEKLSPKVSMWRKNDKYVVCSKPTKTFSTW